MRVPHSHEIEIFFPVRALFLQRCRTVANFDPPCGLVRAKPRIVHVAEVFAFRHGASAEAVVFDGLKQIAFATGLNAGSNKITHNSPKRVPRAPLSVVARDSAQFRMLVARQLGFINLPHACFARRRTNAPALTQTSPTLPSRALRTPDLCVLVVERLQIRHLLAARRTPGRSKNLPARLYL
jgi:hypothetical protein